MDWLKHKKTVTAFILKYRYVILVIAIGLLLMLLPGKDHEQELVTQVQEQTATMKQDITKELQSILSCIHGAGKVEVMLSVAQGELTLYQYDEDVSNGENGASRFETVIVSDSDRGQSGLVRQVNPPTYLGAIVVCQGADSASVRLGIIEAVARVTGLGTDRISVLKMK